MSIRYGRNGFYLSCSCGLTRDYVRDSHGQPQPVEPPALAEEVFCEKCGQPMITKKSRYGSFLACSGYPECKNTKPLVINKEGKAEVQNDPPPPWPEGMSEVCEKCGGQMVPKKTRKGTWFIACSKYPKCSNAKSYPTGFKCPKPGCDGNIVEKQSKRGPFFACSNYPACRVIIKGRPVAQKCPECGLDYMVKSPQDESILTCPNLACPSNPKKTKSPGTASPKEAKPKKTAAAGPKKSAAPRAAKAKAPQTLAESGEPQLKD
jgi:DNA topoisomerase-1